MAKNTKDKGSASILDTSTGEIISDHSALTRISEILALSTVILQSLQETGILKTQSRKPAPKKKAASRKSAMAPSRPPV
jgi:hypothetical protein